MRVCLVRAARLRVATGRWCGGVGGCARAAGGEAAPSDWWAGESGGRGWAAGTRSATGTCGWPLSWCGRPGGRGTPGLPRRHGNGFGGWGWRWPPSVQASATHVALCGSPFSRTVVFGLYATRCGDGERMRRALWGLGAAPHGRGLRCVCRLAWPVVVLRQRADWFFCRSLYLLSHLPFFLFLSWHRRSSLHQLRR